MRTAAAIRREVQHGCTSRRIRQTGRHALVRQQSTKHAGKTAEPQLHTLFASVFKHMRLGRPITDEPAEKPFLQFTKARGTALDIKGAPLGFFTLNKSPEVVHFVRKVCFPYAIIQQASRRVGPVSGVRFLKVSSSNMTNQSLGFKCPTIPTLKLKSKLEDSTKRSNEQHHTSRSTLAYPIASHLGPHHEALRLGSLFCKMQAPACLRKKFTSTHQQLSLFECALLLVSSVSERKQVSRLFIGLGPSLGPLSRSPIAEGALAFCNVSAHLTAPRGCVTKYGKFKVRARGFWSASVLLMMRVQRSVGRSEVKV
eukprot:scaffold43901_cov15-Tisochrysis_lutea.AAC.1